MVLTVVGPVWTDAGGFTVIQQPSCRKYSGWGGGGGWVVPEELVFKLGLEKCLPDRKKRGDN